MNADLPARAGALPGDLPIDRAGSDWLTSALAEVARDPDSVTRAFAFAARRVGRAPRRPDADPSGVVHGTVDDAARAALVVALAEAVGTGPDCAERLVSLYRQGDAAERRGVLRGLDALTDRGSLGRSDTDIDAAALVEAGLGPDVISSDIHALSRHGPMFDLPTCLSKLLALGVSLADAIAAATVRPAEVLGLSPELGTLRPGSAADVALFALERGRFTLYDVTLEARECDALLRNTLTLRAGRRLEPKAPEPAPPWIELSDAQLALHEDSRASVSALPPAAALDRREAFTPAPVDVDEPAPSVVPERG